MLDYLSISVDLIVYALSHVVPAGVLPPPPSRRDTFLRSLAATQWDKKRRSKQLSETRQPLSDDVRTQDPPPAEEGGEVPPEDSPGRAAIVGKQAGDQ